MATESPEVVGALPSVNSQDAGWDANVQANFDASIAGFHTYLITISSLGSHTGPVATRIHIQLCDWEGTPITDRKDRIAVRVCEIIGTDPTEWNISTNATLAAAGGSTQLSTIWNEVTPNKHINLESDAAGLFELDHTNSTAETTTIRIGPPELGGRVASYLGAIEVSTP